MEPSADLLADSHFLNQMLAEFSEGDFPALPLDAATLDAVTASTIGVSPQPDEAVRQRIAQQDNDSSDDEGTKPEPAGKRARTEPGSAAARNKAAREKQRREKINERYSQLAALITEPGGEAKSDKPTILWDAICCVRQLKAENQQIKTMLKILEDRVRQYESERGRSLYQHFLMQHGGVLPGMGGIPAGVASLPSSLPHLSQGGPSSLPGPSGLHATSTQPSLQQMQAAAAAAAAAAVANMQLPSAFQQAAQHAPTPPPQPQPIDTQCSIAATAVKDSSIKSESGHTAAALQGAASATSMSLQTTQHNHAVPNVMMGNAAVLASAAALASNSALKQGVHGAGLQQAGSMPGPMPQLPVGNAAAPAQPFWVQPNMLDVNYDSLLRPPAA